MFTSRFTTRSSSGAVAASLPARLCRRAWRREGTGSAALLRDDLNTFIPCYSCSSYLSSFSRSSRLTQTPRLSSLRIYNNISLILRVWSRLRPRSCTARFIPAVQRVELESRRLLSCTAPASLLIRDHFHQSTSRGPWPYITSTARMSDSEDDKPLVKGAYLTSHLRMSCSVLPRRRKCSPRPSPTLPTAAEASVGLGQIPSSAHLPQPHYSLSLSNHRFIHVQLSHDLHVSLSSVTCY